MVRQDSTDQDVNAGRSLQGPHRGTGFVKRALSGKRAMSPSSSARMVLDGMGIVLLTFDIVLTPVLLAWNVPLEGPLLSLCVAMACFWTLEVISNTFTGYYTATGELEQRIHLTSFHYLRRWFLIDACVVGVDWFALATASHGSGADAEGLSFLRFSKLTRLLRLFNVLRCVRFTRVVAQVADRNLPSFARVLMQVGQLMLVILYWNHLMACMWYFISVCAQSDTGHTWIGSPVVPNGSSTDITFAECSGLFQYLSALHWSMTQMTPASMQVVPTNTPERVVNLLSVLVGCIFFSSIVSSLSAKMMQYRMTTLSKRAKVDVMRSYLSDKGISSELTHRVMQRVRQQLDEDLAGNGSAKFDGPHLGRFSAKLRHDVLCEICASRLQSCFILRTLTSLLSDHSKRTVWRKVISQTVIEAGSALFDADTVADNIYVLLSGAMKYTQDPSTSDVQEDIEMCIEAGTWISELALCLQWTHTGFAEGNSACELLAVDVKAFSISLRHQSPSAFRFLRGYARSLCNTVRKLDDAQARELSDVASPVHRRDVVGGMRVEDAKVLGQACLRALAESWAWAFSKKIDFEQLARETDARRHVLYFNENQEVVRYTSVVSLRLQHHADGTRFLVNIGKWRGGRIEPSCKLPRSRQRDAEGSTSVLNRIQNDKLRPIADLVLVTGEMLQSESTAMSTKFGLLTTCSTHLQVATLVSPLSDVPGVLPIASNIRRDITRFFARSRSLEILDIPPFDWNLWAPMLMASRSHVKLFVWMAPEEFENWSTVDSTTLRRLVDKFHVTEEMVEQVEQACPFDADALCL